MPPVELTPTQHSRTIRAIIAQSMLGTVHGASVGGMFLTGYALKIGLTDLQFGVISTVSMVASSLQILSPFLVARAGSRKRLCIIVSVLNVSMYWLLIAIPHLIPSSPEAWRVYALWAVIGLASFFGSQGGPAMTSWRADLIPERQRGRFWARISSASIPVGMIFAVVEGAYLDKVRTLTGFSVIFIVGIFFGYCSIAAMLRQSDIPVARVEKGQTPWRVARSVFSNRPFMAILLFNLVWGVCGSFTGMFPMVYMIKEVEIPYKFIALLGNMGALVSLLGWPVWGVLVDMYGNRAVMKIGYGWGAASSLLWIFVDKHTWFLLLPLANLVSGFVGPSTVGMTNLMLKSAPRENQSAYFAVFGSATAAAAAFAPTLGGAMLEAMQSSHFDPFGIGRYRMLFAAVGLLLLLCLSLLRWVQEPDRPVTTAYVIKHAWSWRPVAVAVNLLRLSRRTHLRKRERAVSALGDLRSRLAVDELARALDDPSPRVRREAARSLGEIGDERATAHLIAALRHPLAEVRQESALALGKARVAVDLEPLLQSLQDPDPLVQSSAAVALGEIADKRAAEPLLQVLQSSPHCTVRASVASAIASLGRKEDVRFLLAALDREQLPAMRRQFILAVGMLIGGARFYSQAGSQLADQQRLIYRILETERRSALPRHPCLLPVRADVERAIAEALRLYESDDLAGAMRQILAAARLVTGPLSSATGAGTLHWPEDWFWNPCQVPPQATGLIATASVIAFIAQRAAANAEEARWLPPDGFALAAFAYRRLLSEARALLDKPAAGRPTPD